MTFYYMVTLYIFVFSLLFPPLNLLIKRMRKILVKQCIILFAEFGWFDINQVRFLVNHI